MIVKAFNRARIECPDAMELLGIEQRYQRICCRDCPKIDMSRIKSFDRADYNYLQEECISIHPRKADGNRDYLVGVEIISCCFHLDLWRTLSAEQWKILEVKLKVGLSGVPTRADIKSRLRRVIESRSKEKPCMFCSNPTEASDNICSSCKG